MAALFETVVDPVAQADVLRRRRYGVIEMIDGRLRAIHLAAVAPPRLAARGPRVWPLVARLRRGDRALLYYSQPWGHSNYLALRYCLSTRDCRLATARGALVVLDEIARLKQSDAIFADASNGRISDRLLARWGWEPLGGKIRGRTFVKRFYGQHPAPALAPCCRWLTVGRRPRGGSNRDCVALAAAQRRHLE